PVRCTKKSASDTRGGARTVNGRGSQRRNCKSRYRSAEKTKQKSGRKVKSMNRRDFLRWAGVLSATLAFPKTGRLFAQGGTPGSWRTFEVMVRVEVLKPSGTTLVWLPAALISKTPYQVTLANRFSAEGGIAELVESKAEGLGIVSAKFPAGVRPVLTLTSRIAT